ncbi:MULTISPECIES: hypothetical protein [Fictibacillus]|uniref:Uncharacterized protein n=1 Tax=Fictibacillus enclensis TaxID=1017270 RepID=A0A0V8JCD7_9BACL|nr:MULTISPECIES: hypothetical protein [Fictibacillus]KSU84540.1 hypothetical protein AS030_03060 [Fictibacillus enclensis]RXY99823.1 hypothetical protein DMO16_09095 [Fictibacillus sp. S7]SCB81199.1 hypothetical protein GA0061096_0647 [Fictibacillus enclensis]
MNLIEMKAKLLDLKNSQLVRSRITYTIRYKSESWMTIYYAADQMRYEMLYHRDYKRKSFTNINQVCEAIQKEIHKNVRESKP